MALLIALWQAAIRMGKRKMLSPNELLNRIMSDFDSRKEDIYGLLATL
jgi:hypothetical protein